MDARSGNLGNEEKGVWVFDGSTFEESTSFEFEHDAKSRPPASPLSPRDTECTSQITDVCVGIFKMRLRETGQILLA